MRGHTTLDAINVLLNRPSLSQGSVVVLMENINDRLRLALRGGYDADLPAIAPNTAGAISSSLRETVEATFGYISLRSNIAFLLDNLVARWASLRDTSGGWITERTLDQLPLPSEAAQTQYAQNLRVFVAAVRELRKTPVLMTQVLARRSPAHDLFNDRMRDVARQLSVPLIDLDRELPTERDWAFLGDGIHLSNSGSLFTGRVAAAHLAKLIDLNASQSQVGSDSQPRANTEAIGSTD